MTDKPFHVAGGSFSFPAAPRLEMYDTLANLPVVPTETESRGSRRRKLWELAHKCHCPLVGVCFEVDELRSLMARVMNFPRNSGDFTLHTSAVAACETRGPLSELLHKTLEKRYALIVKRFAAAKNADTLAALWRAALKAGTEIPGALWAAWTHPACEKPLEQEIYGDIHMLQHQVGTGTRTDLGTLRALREENARLRKELDQARTDAEAVRAEKARETALLGERVAELRVELAGKDAHSATMAGQLDTLRASFPDLKDRQALARRANDAEAQATALVAHAARLEREVERLRETVRRLAVREEEQACSEDCQPAPADNAAGESISGKCVLCVGGRSGSVDAYRRLVEERGGRFLHHDGGLEESLHRIDTALATADLVICQAGCISHNAYWRVKEQCKRTGKPCIFMKSTGVSSFARLVESAPALAEPAAGA